MYVFQVHEDAAGRVCDVLNHDPARDAYFVVVVQRDLVAVVIEEGIFIDLVIGQLYVSVLRG